MTKRSSPKHFDGVRFFNPGVSSRKGFMEVLKWKLQGAAKPWPKWVENTYADGATKDVPQGTISVTFINHASFLLQTPTRNILTDPVFSYRVSPFTWAGPKRVREPGIALEQLPKIDAVALSHNHYDHMDMASLKCLFDRDRPVFMVPLGDCRHLEEAGITTGVECDWWQDHKVDEELSFTFGRCQHFSGRWTNDRDHCLWGAWVIRTREGKIYFAGDTGYSDHFVETTERLGPMDLCLIPIGAYEPRWIMRDMHMDPEEAVKAHIDLQATTSIAMHFGTFQLTDEGIDVPVRDLQQALAARGKQGQGINFHVMKEGQTWIYDVAKGEFCTDKAQISCENSAR